MFNIKMAELVIKIDNKYDYLLNLCKDYIVSDDETVDFSVSATAEEIQAEQDSSESSFSKGYLESICVYRKIAAIIPRYNAFLFHSAVVEVDGEAYAFTAKSGVGKTTHIRLWKELLGEKVRIINGDKPIFKVFDDKVIAYGTPWCGKEGYNINTCAPLKAICFVERGESNKIFDYEKSAAVGKIVHQIYIPKSSDDIIKLLNLLDSTMKLVDVWKLKCTIDIKAAQLSYNTMKGGQLNED